MAEELRFYRLENSAGDFAAEIVPFGAAVAALSTPGADGRMVNVAAGLPAPDDYRENPDNFGAVVGRVANRISSGSFELDGRIYHLDLNEPGRGNTLHGGNPGYAHRLWRVIESGRSFIRLGLDSPDGESGFPGAVCIEVRYTVTDRRELRIDYIASPDRPTPVSLTGHAYFNLNGEGAAMDGHSFSIAASRRVEVDSRLAPTGALPDVGGTVYDLRGGRSFTEIMEELPRGFDDCFVLDNPSVDRPSLRAFSRLTGISMEMYTDFPGVQFCMCNFLNGRRSGRSGRPYGPFSAFCCEAEYFPDSVHFPAFPSVVFSPDRPFEQTVIYRFGAGYGN